MGHPDNTVIPDTARFTLQNNIYANVEKGSKLSTDKHTCYDGLNKDYVHQVIDHTAKEYVRGQVHTNNIENFWSRWKRCIKGTHIHLAPEYMSRYLDEEMFRYNNRKSNDAGRFLLVANSVIGSHLTYRKLKGRISAKNVASRHRDKCCAANTWLQKSIKPPRAFW